MMTSPDMKLSLERAFTGGRTAHGFTAQKLTHEQLQALYDWSKWGPTCFNAQPARFVFVTTPEGKEKLATALAPGNLAQTLQAPLTVIVGYDTQFFEHLPRLYPAYDAKKLYENNPGVALDTAYRSGTLQGGYLIMAARLMGLAVGPMSGFNADRVNELFFSEGRIRVNFLINIGYPSEDAFYPRNPRLSFSEAVQIV
jgi:nitroreductase